MAGLTLEQLQAYQKKLQTPDSFPDSLWSKIKATPAGPAWEYAPGTRYNPAPAPAPAPPIASPPGWGQAVPTQPASPSTGGATSNTGGGATGLLGGAINRTSFNNSDYGYTPELGTVNSQTDTVQGQLAGLLSKSSPYITRARTSAAQAMNARGGLNSSMAAGAGEAAAIDASLPIAAADAGTYSAQRLANQAAVVDRLLENLKAKNISALSAQEANQLRTLTAQKGDIDRQLQMLVGSQQSSLQSERYASQAQLDKANQDFEMLRQKLSGDQAKELENIRREGMLVAQSSQSAASLSASMFAAMTAAMSDPNTKPADKDAAVARLTSMYKSGLTVTGGIANIDIAGLLDWTAASSPGAASPTLNPLELSQLGGRLL